DALLCFRRELLPDMAIVARRDGLSQAVVITRHRGTVGSQDIPTEAITEHDPGHLAKINSLLDPLSVIDRFDRIGDAECFEKYLQRNQLVFHRSSGEILGFIDDECSL